MTDRGRAHKNKSPVTKCAKTKTRLEEVRQVYMDRCNDFTEERQNGIRKERKPKEHKKTDHTELESSAQSALQEKAKKHVTEEIDRRQPTPKDSTKDAVKGAKAKTCAHRAKTTEKPAEKIKKAQLWTQNDTTEDSDKTTKATTHAGKAKKHVTEEIDKCQPTPKDSTKDAVKGTKAKTCADRAKTTEKPAEKIKKAQLRTQNNTTEDSDKITKATTHAGKAKPEIFAQEPPILQDTTNAPVLITKPKPCARRVESPQEVAGLQQETTKPPKKCAGVTRSTEELNEKAGKDKDAQIPAPQHRHEDKAAVDSILSTTLKQLKIKKNERSDAAKVINNITQIIITHLKEKSEYFKEVEPPLRTGSYYENLKISNPDEFDVMLPIPVDRVDIEPFGEDGAFYSVALKRGKSPLKSFQENDTLAASKMLKEFRKEVKASVKEHLEWEVTKTKTGCPAVTLTTKVNATIISLDVVLSLMVRSSWPPFTKDGLKIEGWLGAKVKTEHKRKPYYLVPKYEGRGNVEKDGVLAKDIWRVSFSHVEKAILMNHGSEKTCCEKGGEPCCRKDCLKLLKHLLSLLKEKDPSLDKFCSYHAKTTLLHACSTRTKDSEWRASDLSHCFTLLLKDFVNHLERGELNNFFIPTQNLLSRPSKKICNILAARIREECDNGFPIFK